MFFHLRPDTAVLSDLNGELIELYTVVRDNVNELITCLEGHQSLHGKVHYYAVRSSIPSTRVGRAARTLYLNRTCWNGLYRVNLKGEFNVPIGTKTSVAFGDDTLINASRALATADILCSDFEATIGKAGSGDYIFVDPPYTVQHNLNGFLKYNEHIFSWADQVRLRDAVAAAIERGAAIAVTNADHESVRQLYADVCDYSQLGRASVLSGVASRRGKTTEALFYANLK